MRSLLFVLFFLSTMDPWSPKVGPLVSLVFVSFALELWSPEVPRFCVFFLGTLESQGGTFFFASFRTQDPESSGLGCFLSCVKLGTSGCQSPELVFKTFERMGLGMGINRNGELLKLICASRAPSPLLPSLEPLDFRAFLGIFGDFD